MILKMKYNFFFILLLIISCTTYPTKIDNLKPYSSKGFAYIYNERDANEKLIKGKLNDTKLEVSHSSLKTNALIKIINPKTNDNLVLRNKKRINYPDFYKVLITSKVADKLNLNRELPFVEILEIKKNKSFVAKKAKIFQEEKKISSNAPVASVQISNISKNKDLKNKKKKDIFFILIGSFYSKNVADFLKNRISKEIPEYNVKKLRVVKKSDKKTHLISGPYYTINLMKNDYIQLKNFGFEELDIINE